MGKTVAIVESKKIAEGLGGHTTTKVTSLHQLIYADLLKNLGLDKAQVYAESNQAALERVAKFVSDEQIDFDFSRRSAYTFAESEQEFEHVEDEYEAALKLGLPAHIILDT